MLIPSTVFAVFNYNSDEFQKLIIQFDMQGHADHDLSTCTVKKVYYEEVVDMLNEGKNEKEIVQSYVDEYGQAALRTPGTEGTELLAWAMPAVGFLAGTFIVSTWIKKLTSRRNELAQETSKQSEWESETDKEIFERTMDEERRKLF